LDQRSGKLWIIKAFGIFLLGLMFWFILAVWTGTSFALDLTFAQDLRSNLLANYGDGPSNTALKYLSLTILGDVFSDQGDPDDSIGLLENLFLAPVPTATIAGAPEMAVQPPTNTPTPGPDFTETAMAAETESSLVISSLTETPTASSTSTATGTPTSTITPTSTKTNVPTKTPTPTTKPSNTPVIDDVYPILECVEYKGGGMWKAYFGYMNPSTETQYVPIGTRNYFKPDPKDRGQTTTFLPGRSKEYPGAAFSVDFEENAVLTWHLTAYSVEASRYSEYCDYFEPTPTHTSIPQDTKAPILSGGQLNPQPGFIDDCSANISIDYLVVDDPAYSSGIQWVKLKYVVENFTSEIYSNPLNLVDGGTTIEGGWYGHYSGSVTVNIDPEWTSPAPDSFHINLWAKARDNASHEGLSFLGTYTMPARCGKSSE
jgi:hypothetical protein